MTPIAVLFLAFLPSITIDYPADRSIFPPEITAPEFIWRDDSPARMWSIEITFANASATIQANSQGDRLHLGEIDPRCVAPTNELPQLTPEQAAAHTWRPAEDLWTDIKNRSAGTTATLTITGYDNKKPLSRASITFKTSTSPVGAPVFYRDVPLMPSELERGVIKPLAASAIPLIAWRIRDIAEPRSRLLMEGLHTCANCHSFSRDGKTIGMDLDGPQNDKGMYALARLTQHTTIRSDEVISWKSFRDQPSGQMRVGFMSQVSPNGRYVVTTVSGFETDARNNYFVVNFRDYRFLQVFYATRGILVYYDRVTGRRQSLPGADDPRYVQTNAVWSPDGDYLIFARALARDAYSEGRKLPEFANDPNETPMQYDLYRIPFNNGRGGTPEAIPGASRNGMSNSFPRISPDGRWLVFVQARNGLLMRPDSQLYIVPTTGGIARRMRCNTPIMNSWHSFSPNGRWMVFSSKARSPYTRMFLTHIDEQGNDSPPILIDNVAAANRAVNLPEFVNVPPGGLATIDIPAVESYRLFDEAFDLTVKGQFDLAIPAWKKVVDLDPGDARALNNLGFALSRSGQLDAAISVWRKAIDARPDYPDVHRNLGLALIQLNRFAEASAQLEQAVALSPDHAEAHNDLGVALLGEKKLDAAISRFQRAAELNPNYARALFNLGNAYYMRGQTAAALAEWRKGLRLDSGDDSVLNQAAWVLATSSDPAIRNAQDAIEFATLAIQHSGGREPAYIDTLAAAYAEAGRFTEALQTARHALSLATQLNRQPLIASLQSRIDRYGTGTPYRE